MKLIRNLMSGVWAYAQHSAANKAEYTLQQYKDRDLMDIGMNRASIHAAVHSDCPWCKGK